MLTFSWKFKVYRRLYSRDPLSLNRAISLVEILRHSDFGQASSSQQQENASLCFRAVGKRGEGRSPLRVLQISFPISVGKQIFLLFPLDFRSTYGPDSSPFFDPWKFVTSLSSALIGCFCNFQPIRRRFITNHVSISAGTLWIFNWKWALCILKVLK